jgi:putative membrane protein
MRRTLLMLGMLALAAVWLTPVPQFARYAFWAHMSMHMVVVAVAAPLLALGVAGGRLDPVYRAPGLFAPIPLSVVELIVVWVWHAPHLHHLARESVVGLVAEQGSFLVSGLVVWLAAFGGGFANAASRRAAGVVALLLTSMHMTLLGALIALAPRLLYHHMDTHSALTPLDDQQLGGAIMLLVGGVSYLTGGVWLTFGLTRTAALKTGEKACLSAGTRLLRSDSILPPDRL